MRRITSNWTESELGVANARRVDLKQVVAQ
jgi:hypothetical protein